VSYSKSVYPNTQIVKVRSELIASRLDEIRLGKAGDLIATVDARERDKATLCVGVRWTFSAEDLQDFVRVSVSRRTHFAMEINTLPVPRRRRVSCNLSSICRRLRTSRWRCPRPVVRCHPDV